MEIRDKIIMAKNILNNAMAMNISEELLLIISQKVDEYIVKYYDEEIEKESNLT